MNLSRKVVASQDALTVREKALHGRYRRRRPALAEKPRLCYAGAKVGNALPRPLNEPLYALPLFGPARLLFQGKEVRLSQKGLVLLYYLALEGPTSRARLAELLYAHGTGLQNLRVELYRLGQALGRRVFPRGQDPLVLPPWIYLDGAGQGRALEGLEEPWEWIAEVRERYEAPPGLSERRELLQELSALRPPFLLVLRGRLGAGQRAFAQALARTLGLSFHETLRPEGLVYLEPPYPQIPLRELLRSRSLLVFSLGPGEEPRLFLELRAHYPVAQTRLLDLPPLAWPEAREGALAGVDFPEAARAYFWAGGQPEWIPEWLACPQGPQRPLAQLRLQARLLSEPARLALERLSVAMGTIPEEVLDALGALPHLDELERKGWLAYREGYRFAKEAERRLLYLALPPGRRRELHERAAIALALSGKPEAEAVHRRALGERLAGLGEGLFGQGPKRALRLGLGPERVLLPHQREGVLALREGFAVVFLEPGETAFLALAEHDEEVVLELSGTAYSPEDTQGLRLTLRAPRGEMHLGLERTFRHLWFLRPGPLRLSFQGLGLAEFTLRAYRPKPGAMAAYDLAAEEVQD